MQKPEKTEAERRLSVAFDLACGEAKRCETDGDIAGQDAWLLAVSAIQLAIERTKYAHDVMDWTLRPEPKTVIAAGTMVCMDSNGCVLPAGSIGQAPAIGFALNSAPAHGMVNVMVGGSTLQLEAGDDE